MKVGFHFNVDHPSLRSAYGYKLNARVFSVLLERRALNISTKIFVGDLLLHEIVMDSVPVPNGHIEKFNREKFVTLVDQWRKPKTVIWSRFDTPKVGELMTCNVYVVCLESADLQLAEYLHQALEKYPPYLGALEVDDSSPIHWQLYSSFLKPQFRMINRTVSIFWEGSDESSKDEALLQELRNLGFEEVKFESLSGRYSIFDEYHDFEHARRVAKWKNRFGDLLAFIADETVSSLGDAAPDLGDKLWGALETFEDAETNEQLAQVAASCRRILDYVGEQLFPPVGSDHKGHKLGSSDYRNRLLAFADKERKSDTNIDVIIASTEMLNEQLEKLLKLANKGVHAEISRAETRRCLLRTILLLNDIISLKSGPFDVKVKADVDKIVKMLK